MLSHIWRRSHNVARHASRRNMATTAHDPSKIRNMALVAHIDSGKTTLTESILFKSDYLSSSGTVDTGSTTTDFLPAERARGITIQSASIPVKWKEWTFNLIDTPGHADFGMEVESASRVIDGAVVLIDSVEGVEAQTKGVWKQLDRYGVKTRMIFLNKLDRPGSSFSASLSSLLTNRLHPNPMAITLPIASFDPQNYRNAEPGIEGLVDLVNWEVRRYGEEGQVQRYPLPVKAADLEKLDFLLPSHPLVPHLASARMALLENLSMTSEDLMETLLALPDSDSFLALPPTMILPHLRDAVLQNKILPVLCGAAAKNIGTDLVLDYVGNLLASPADLSDKAIVATEPLRALAWKVIWDQKRGWMTFVRIYSGTLKKQTTIMNVNRGTKEKVSKLMLLYASQSEEVETLQFGSVGVILGLRHTRTGDTLVAGSANSDNMTTLQDIIPPPAVVSASVIPDSHSDLEPVQTALEALSRTDPSVRVDVQEGQILVHGLGALHLEIVEGRLKDEWGARFEFGKRQVSFREGASSGITECSKTVEVSGVPVSISLQIRPLEMDEKQDPLWQGNVVVDAIGRPFASPESGSSSPQSAIAAGLMSSLSNSVHSSLALSHVHVTVKSFTTPSPASLLAGASAIVLRDLIRERPMGPVMEPYFTFKVSVPEESLGKIVKDLTEHGGEVQDLGGGLLLGNSDSELGAYSEDGVYIPPVWLSPSAAGSPSAQNTSSTHRMKRAVHAIAPLSQMLDYSSRLRAHSGGHGTFEMASAGFRQVSEARKLEILKEIGRA